jgi:peptide chain release factor 1
VAAYRDTMKAIAEIEEVVAKFRELRDIRKRIAEAREMLHADDDMRELAEMELAELEPREPVLESELKILLQPKDPNDDKNVFVEVRAGTGGDEASLFAAEIMRMYIRYAEQSAGRSTSPTPTTPRSTASRTPRCRSKATRSTRA